MDPSAVSATLQQLRSRDPDRKLEALQAIAAQRAGGASASGAGAGASVQVVSDGCAFAPALPLLLKLATARSTASQDVAVATAARGALAAQLQAQLLRCTDPKLRADAAAALRRHSYKLGFDGLPCDDLCNAPVRRSHARGVAACRPHLPSRPVRWCFETA